MDIFNKKTILFTIFKKLSFLLLYSMFLLNTVYLILYHILLLHPLAPYKKEKLFKKNTTSLIKPRMSFPCTLQYKLNFNIYCYFDSLIHNLKLNFYEMNFHVHELNC